MLCEISTPSPTWTTLYRILMTLSARLRCQGPKSVPTTSGFNGSLTASNSVLWKPISTARRQASTDRSVRLTTDDKANRSSDFFSRSNFWPEDFDLFLSALRFVSFPDDVESDDLATSRGHESDKYQAAICWHSSTRPSWRRRVANTLLYWSPPSRLSATNSKSPTQTDRTFTAFESLTSRPVDIVEYSRCIRRVSSKCGYTQEHRTDACKHNTIVVVHDEFEANPPIGRVFE